MSRIKRFLDRACDEIFGLIENPVQRFTFILSRYFIVLVTPFVTDVYIFDSYPAGIRFFWFLMVALGIFYAFCIFLDIYIGVKKLINIFLNPDKNARKKN